MFLGLQGLAELCIDRVPSVTDAGACVIKGKGSYFVHDGTNSRILVCYMVEYYLMVL